MIHYWLDDTNAPFATLLRVVGTYCHPEAGPEAYEDLVRWVRSRPDDPEVQTLRSELAALLAGQREGLHPDALFTAACYGDGSDDAFLLRLHGDLGFAPVPRLAGVQQQDTASPNRPAVRRYHSWDDWSQARPALVRLLPWTTVNALADAYSFAVRCHGDQTRPAGEPYVQHLLQTLEIVLDSEELRPEPLVAALLHDVAEDTACTLDEVRDRYGEGVAGLVDQLTAQPGGSPGARAAYLARIAAAPTTVLCVKLADRYSNVQDLRTHPRPDRARAYYRETVDHILPLTHRIAFYERLYAEWATAYHDFTEPAGA